MKIDTYACDVCQTQKKETNHWWVMHVFNGQPPASSEMRINPWNGSALSPVNEFWSTWHLCGEACVQKKVSEFLSGGK